MGEIVICQSWGGLGDNLQYTTLPELFHNMGFKVYISDKNAYRNSEIYDLVWKLNPYIQGISDLPPNAGECRGMNLFTDNFLRNIELSHSLYNGFREYPIIYYKPKYVDNIDKYIFYDTTSISTNPGDLQLKTAFENIFSKHPNLIPCKIKFIHIDNREIENFSHEEYIIHNIYEYCDLLYSCKVFVTGFSGASHLCSAVKQENPTPIIYSFHTPEGIQANAAFYKFKNVNYLPLPSL